ncbi:MAG: phosphoribosyltransferase family protein [Patescibacteria group bacterium]
MSEQHTRLVPAEEVNRKIGEIASQLLENHPDTSPLFVALLRGAAPFSSKLMLEIARQSPDYHPEIDYMMVSTYGDERHAGEPHIVTDLAPSTTVKDRDVIIIDDVLDKGITTDFVTKHLQARGAAAIRLAVLCDKRTARERDITADYVGFTFDDNWLVGMGMDDAQAAKEGYRWLEEIWEIKR